MSQAVQPQVNDIAVSASNPMPVVIIDSSQIPSGSSPTEALISLQTFAGAAGNLAISIPSGAREISVSNTGTLDLSFKSASMVLPTPITPATQPGATTISITAPSGTVLEAILVTVADVGQSAEILVIR